VPHRDVKNLIPAIQLKTVVDFMNHVQFYNVSLQNTCTYPSLKLYSGSHWPALTWEGRGKGTERNVCDWPQKLYTDDMNVRSSDY